MKKILMILLMLSLSVLAADKKHSDEIDHVALAALLLKDGLTSRAAEELKQVNLEDENIDKGRYYTLEGLVYTKQFKYEKANASFTLALQNSEVPNKALYLYMAQNSFKLKDYKGTLASIKSADE